MKLPRSLAPWANELQIFPDEISLILGNYARKISPLLGPLSYVEPTEAGEPDGYDGVARLGIYERLLISELALADEFADEFVRRAVMGEHLFLSLAKSAANSKRVTIAIFDAGAMQLGTPRIAHLAILIVLARRAATAGAMFLWGTLQDPKQLVISDDTEASLKILLESRQADGVKREDIAAWHEKLSDVPKTSDVWLVGGESLADFEESKSFSHLYVDDVLEPGKNELLLKVKSASGAINQTTLELPHQNLCTRLLRNPFDAVRKPGFSTKQLGGTVTNFFFDQKGTKLFAKLDSTDVLLFNVQNMPGEAKVYPTVYRQWGTEKHIAIGNLRKAVVLLSQHDYQTLRLSYKKYGFGLKEGLYKIDEKQFNLPAETNGLLPIYNLRPENINYNEAAVLDAKGNLFSLKEGKSDSGENTEHLIGFAEITATDVLAVVQTDKEFIFVGREVGNDVHQIVFMSGKTECKEIPIKQITKAIFGRGEQGRKVLALESAQSNWAIVSDGVLSEPFEPEGAVTGVYQDSRFAPSAGLFELMEDRQTLDFVWERTRRKTVLTASEEIIKIEFSPRSPILAYQTASGELIIYSLTHRTTIGRYSK